MKNAVPLMVRAQMNYSSHPFFLFIPRFVLPPFVPISLAPNTLNLTALYAQFAPYHCCAILVSPVGSRLLKLRGCPAVESTLMQETIVRRHPSVSGRVIRITRVFHAETRKWQHNAFSVAFQVKDANTLPKLGCNVLKTCSPLN